MKKAVVEGARARGSESEKITINLGPIDLGQIDLLVEEGFYSNRTDLIRTAIRNQLALHAPVVQQTVERRALVLGMQHFSRQDLEAVRDARGKRRGTAVLICAIGNAKVVPTILSSGNHFGIRREASVGNT